MFRFQLLLIFSRPEIVSAPDIITPVAWLQYYNYESMDTGTGFFLIHYLQTESEESTIRRDTKSHLMQ